MTVWPNNPDAVSPARALWLAIVNQWRRVSDLVRQSASRFIQKQLALVSV